MLVLVELLVKFVPFLFAENDQKLNKKNFFRHHEVTIDSYL